MYNTSFIRAVQAIAIDEGLLGKPRKNIGSTNFSARCWSVWRELGLDSD
jgi:hypothetical protein